MTSPGGSDLQLNSDSGNKRPIADTSFDNVKLEEAQQHKKPSTSDVVGATVPVVSENSNLSTCSNSSISSVDSVQVLESLASIQSFFSEFDKRFSNLADKLEATNNNLAANNRKLDEFNSKFDNLFERISELEAKSSQQENQIIDLQSRVQNSAATLDSLTSRVSGLDTTLAGQVLGAEWEPRPVPNKKVLLIGDSNSAGKIKFGTARGTLGKSLPGSSLFIPEHQQFPEPDSVQLRNYSDIVIATATNDLAKSACDPAILALNLSRYSNQILSVNPTSHIFIPGVLPTRSEQRNAKINTYNLYLDDMCRVNPKLTFVDLNGFRDNNGKLADKLAVGGTDVVHLNNQGIKLYASKLKAVLRQRHHLPNFTPHRPRSNRNVYNQGPVGRNNSDNRNTSGSGNGRGGHG